MPNVEPVVLAGERYTLRHVGPQAAVWPTSPAAPVALLNRTDMVARPLPTSGVPGDADFVSGTWNGRVGDAADGTFVFPNKEASDGVPWRERFDAAGHLQFLEVYDNGLLDFVGVIDQVVCDQQKVTVHCSDGWFLAKKAYERDWTTIQAPHDVVERATRVWRPLIVDDFAYQGSSLPGSQWTVSSVVSVQANPTVAADDASLGGTVAWSNMTNAFVVDNTYASATVDIYDYLTHYLKLTSYNFAIPAGATITGIQAILYWNRTVSSQLATAHHAVKPVKAGVVQPSLFQTVYLSQNNPYSGGYYDVFGASTDLWGGSWTPADINNSGFGFAVQVTYTGTGSTFPPPGDTNQHFIDAIAVTVWYTTTAGVQMRQTGGVTFNCSSTPGTSVAITSTVEPSVSPIWSAESAVLQLPASGATYQMQVMEDATPVASVQVAGGVATLLAYDQSGVVPFTYDQSLNKISVKAATLTPAAAAIWDLRLECDGEWIWGFINGQLIGVLRRFATLPGALQMQLSVTSSGVASSAVITSAILETEASFLQAASARATPANRAGAGANLATIGTQAWSNPNNIAAAGVNAVAATAGPLSNAGGGNDTTNYLAATNFGFNIPSNATVTGCELRLLRSSNAGSPGTFGSPTPIDNAIYLVAGGAIISVNKANTGYGWDYSQSLNTGFLADYGGIRDQWGVSGGLTPAIVNSSSFGVWISAKVSYGSGGGSVAVFNPVTLVVYYTLPGGDSGDFVLPGDQSTYPWGGLHGRYFNDADIAADPAYLRKLLAPPRRQAYAGSGASEYANQQDASINHANTATPTWAPSPGVGVTAGGQVYFSVIWFGAIYLKLSAGDYGFAFAADDGVRVWIGKTQWGDQIIDAWYQEGAVTYTATLTAASLAGSPGYGAPAVARDGWYPIVIEYFQGSGNAAAQLYFQPPAAYTDPGGTALAANTQVIVPATSLSPLGCVDNRYQGVSHYDLAQQTVQGYGYQASVEPQQLESGQFPGVLAPRIREGHDTDIVLEPDRSARQDLEGLVNHSSTEDATDFVSSLQGNGAGFQSGTTGQLQARVYDAATTLASLFDVQGWQDFSDASYASLLQALLNSQLGLRLEPWQLLSADPNGQPRLAYTWPLPGALEAMRWRPGDGIRIHAADINVWDTAPRQILTITRNILPTGVTSTQASFANRPRTPARTLKQQLYAATRWQRNYQKQLVTLSGSYQWNQTIAAASSAAVWSIVQMSGSDTIVRVRLRVSVVSGTSPSIGVDVNGTDETAALSGPWTVGPLNLDLTSVAVPTADGRIYAQIINKSASNSVNVDWQLFVDVVR